MTLDVPDEVRSTALADGQAAWLDDLPSVLDSLAQDWSLTIGATMRGGHTALVVEATLADGAPSVLKVGIPGYRRQLGFEATVLDLDAGKSCARLIRRDLTRDALLLERLGPTMYDVIVDHSSQHDMCATSSRSSGARSTTTSTCRPAPTWHIGCSTSYRSSGRSWNDHARQRRLTTPSNVPIAASALINVERRCSCMATFMKRTHSRQKVAPSS
jgi:Aminoglycoside/hydroxyurea antibiotic resistance kinase